jgi:hypothetical protein
MAVAMAEKSGVVATTLSFANAGWQRVASTIAAQTSLFIVFIVIVIS